MFVFIISLSIYHICFHSSLSQSILFVFIISFFIYHVFIISFSFFRFYKESFLFLFRIRNSVAEMNQQFYTATIRFLIRFLYLTISFCIFQLIQFIIVLILRIAFPVHEVHYFTENLYPYQLVNCSYRSPVQRIIRIPFNSSSFVKRKETFKGRRLSQRIYSDDGIIVLSC